MELLFNWERTKGFPSKKNDVPQTIKCLFDDRPYLLYKPNSYEQNPQNSCPLIVFLHGGSIEENEFETLKEKGINQYITDGNELESLVVSPLHYDPDKFWSE